MTRERRVAGLSVIREKGQSLQVLFVGVFSAICLACAGHCLWLGLSLANPLPLADQWAFVQDYLNYLDGHYSWIDLFSQHNEHRLTTTRIVLFADAILFGMRGLFPVAVMYACLAAMAAIGALLIGSRSNTERLACFAAALGLLWSPAQWQVFGWQFQAQFPFVHLFALILFVAVSHASQSRFLLWIMVALAADALCVFSLGSGIFVIVPALLLTLFLRSWRAGALLAVFHSALVAFYFTGYQRPDASLPYYFEPFKSLGIAAEFIGFALGKHEAIFGALGLALFAAVAVHLAYLAATRRPTHPACYIMAALACFVVVEAAVVGYARSGYGVGPRYATASVVFWAALFAVLWKLTEGRVTRSLVPVMVGGAIFAMNAPQFEASWREQSAFLTRVTAELRRGEYDPVSMERLCPHECAVQPARRLQRLGIGPFRPGL